MTMTNKLYNHAFTIAFTLDTNNEGDKVTAPELIEALERRLKDLKENPEEIIEAVGLPYDSYNNDVAPSVEFIVKE